VCLGRYVCFVSQVRLVLFMRLAPFARSIRSIAFVRFMRCVCFVRRTPLGHRARSG
jgi:hypothetical protein